MLNKSYPLNNLWLTYFPMFVKLHKTPVARAKFVRVCRPKVPKRGKKLLALSLYLCRSEKSGAPTVKTPRVLSTDASMIGLKKSGCFCVKIVWLK